VDLFQRGFDSLLRFGQRFALGGADRLGMFLQLAVRLRLSLSQIFDQRAFPQPVVKVGELLDDFDPDRERLADRFGRLDRRLARGRVDRLDFQRRDRLDRLSDLVGAPRIERDVQRALDSTLFIKVGQTWTD